METVKTILSILGMIGVPSLGVVVGWLVKYVKADRKARKAETEALKKGVQAILRNQMITNYNKWHEDKGCAPIWVKDNFENLWLQYEALGENGVMKELHDKFMKLPTEPPKKK